MKKLTIIIISFLALFSAEAAHIIGGEITYVCLGGNQYEFTMKIYRDCGSTGALFDSAPGSTTIGTVTVYEDGSTVEYDLDPTIPGTSGVVQLNPPTITNIPPDVSNPCLIIPDDVCVEEGIYQFTLTLPTNPKSYHIVYQRCCRNNSINNIILPGDTGATYSIELTPEAQQTSTGCVNNSPTFNNFPPIIICANEPINFDHSASDSDGDQLVYKFCSPKTGGGTDGVMGGDANAFTGVAPNPDAPPPYQNITFVSGTYGPLNPMGGNPQVSIDAATGLITGIPNTLGQFVVGVCVEEYRNGVLLSVVKRDFQFNVENCEPTVFAQIQNDEVVNGNEFVINSCGNNSITFIDQSFDQAFINTYNWSFDLNNGDTVTSTTQNTSVTFPGLGTYQGQLILNQGSPCDDTATIFVNIYPEINADFTYAYDTCVAGPVSFNNLSASGAGAITGNLWEYGDGNSGNDVSPDYLYSAPGNIPVTLTVEDMNGCVDDTTQIIEWYPAPPILIIEPSIYKGCIPQNVFFNNLSTPIDDTYDIVWDFGDGNTSGEISPTYVYETPGVFDVSLSVTSPIGCSISDFFPSLITVEPSPVANFTFTPNPPTNFQPDVEFTDLSIDAVQWFWNFDDVDNSFDQNPTYTFPDTGLQKVTLIVTHESGCQDTLTQCIDVVPKVAYFLPNAFTPNFDSVNDEFFGKGFFVGMENFNMKIWNRWGEMVFETGDPFEGWNGKKLNTGKDSPQGVYVVVVTYTGPRGGNVELKGFATIVK
ncbi:MAG: PKD domain-containing protein [Saprospiraceae bacterium]